MITVLLFARLKDELGTGRIELPWEEAPVSALLALVQSRYPHVSFQGILTAVNEELSTRDQTVKPGDTVALLPPVSGG